MGWLEDPHKRWLVGTAGLVGVAAAAAWESSRLADPLPDAATLLLTVVGMAVAASVVASWWFVLAASAVLVLAALVIADSGFDLVSYLVFGFPVGVLVLACGTLLGRPARPRVGGRPLLAGTLVLCIVVPAAAAAWDVVRPARDRDPDNPLTVDWRRGTYEGLRLGDRTAKLVAVVGEPEKRGPNERAEPVGEDFYDIGGMTNFTWPDYRSPARDEELRYRRRVFSMSAGRLTSWGTTDDRAETPEGVGVGDSRQIVEERYPKADCYIENEGSEYPTYPFCLVRVCRGRLLGFGGEPIKSVWLAAETKEAVERCVDPTAVRRSP